MNKHRVPRLAVVGCGAIARSFYLPAMVSGSEKPDIVLVDRSLEQARSLASEFGIGETAADHLEVVDGVDGAVVATPPATHAPIALDFLRAGVPVLCEKPLAARYPEAVSLVNGADDLGVPLGVNQVLRLYPALRKARELYRAGAVGELRRVQLLDGTPYGWPLVTNTVFGRDGQGRGVLADIGAHMLDGICWLLDDRPALRSYRDDSMGGAEGVARVEFELGRCAGVVHLSWISKLPGEFLIEGTDGYLRGRLKSRDPLTLGAAGGSRTRRIRLGPDMAGPGGVPRFVIDNLIQVVRGQAEPFAPARTVLPSLQLIDECYASRDRLHMPWMEWQEA